MANSNYEIVLQGLREEPKTWLVTGVAGFIGSHLLEHLLRLGQNVTGLDNFSTGFLKNIDDVRDKSAAGDWDRFRFIDGDIRNMDDCIAAVENVDYVLHQAALGSVPRSVEDPVLTNENNVSGFVNLITAAKDERVKRFVFASSSSVYGDHPALPKIEKETGRPLSPYAVTKLVDEFYADVFGECYGLQSIGLRYFNVFGPRQDPHGAYAAVVPVWFAALFEGREAFINGDGETSRDFCFVDNAVQANILSACTDNPDAVNKVYNVAFSQRTSLNELFAAIRDQVSMVRPEVTDVSPVYRDFRAGDIRHSLADITRAQDLLGYEPLVSVPEGMALTCDWFVKRTSSGTA